MINLRDRFLGLKQSSGSQNVETFFPNFLAEFRQLLGVAWQPVKLSLPAEVRRDPSTSRVDPLSNAISHGSGLLLYTGRALKAFIYSRLASISGKLGSLRCRPWMVLGLWDRNAIEVQEVAIPDWPKPARLGRIGERIAVHLGSTAGETRLSV